MNEARAHALVVSLAILAAGCATYQLPAPSAHNEVLPLRLSETGLYRDPSLLEIAPGVRAYTPRFELFSDGAEKRRWIRLPEGERIDTSDMDRWSFPVGTQFFKEFSHGGRRIETRLMMRVSEADDGWAAASYLWNREGTDALLVEDGHVDALETAHDVPSARACMTCHGGRVHRVLGFSAIQLSDDAVDDGDLTLEALVEEGLTTTAAGPYAVPGSAVEAAALGYLHVNCGSCHAASRRDDGPNYHPRSDLDLWLRTDALSTVSATPTYRTALPRFVVPGDPMGSELYQRASSSGFLRPRMPPLGADLIDDEGLTTLERWIAGMPSERTEE